MYLDCYKLYLEKLEIIKDKSIYSLLNEYFCIFVEKYNKNYEYRKLDNYNFNLFVKNI